MVRWWGLFFLLAIQSTNAETKNQMQNLQRVLSSLLTKVSSDAHFFEGSNFIETESELNELKNLAHELRKQSPSTGNDPIYNYLPTHLEQDAEEAARAYHDRNLVYARALIRSVSDSCIACHTKDTLGAKFPGISLKASLPLKPLELAQFYSATRQFDQAESIYAGIIESPGARGVDLDEAIRQSFAIAIRVKNDPKLALSLVEKVIKSPEAPVFLKLNALAWKKSIQEWKAKKSVPETSAALLQEAKRLLREAEKLKKFDRDRAGDIQYLRATELLHDLLRKSPPSKILGEALYLLGQCYSVLSPYHFDDFSNLYFEACIRNSPHTDLSEKCYHRFEQNLYFGYTKSSGTHVPENMSKKLVDLWLIATKNPDKAL